MSCLFIHPTSHELDIYSNSLFDDRLWTTIAEQTKIYSRSNIRIAGPGIDAIDAMSYISDRQHAC